MASYSQILKYTGMLGGVQVLNILMSIVRNKFTAVLIGPWGMGVVTIYSKAAELVSEMTNFGISLSAVQRLAELQERKGGRQAVELQIKVVRSWTLLAALLGLLVCWLFAAPLSFYLLGDYHSTRGFLRISPMVPMLTLLGGELAILKGLHRLRQMAAASAVVAVLTTISTATIYWLLGVHGIVPVLLTTTAVTLGVNLYATTREFPYRVGLGSLRLMKRGTGMLRLGGAFVLAGVLASGSDLFIAGFIRDAASPHAVGLYAAGYTLTVYYARLIFSAMDADYLPRLTASGNDLARRNADINRQIDVLVMLMVPFLILFALALPILVPLLYKEEFQLAVPMVLCALSYMFFKAVYSPISYLALARNDSLTYLVMETAYDVVYILCVCVGYKTHGLVGAGVGLSAANFFDFVSISLVYSWRYGFRYTAATLWRTAAQFVLLIIALSSAALLPFWIHIFIGLAATVLSLKLSWRLLREERAVRTRIEALRQRFLFRGKKQ